MALPTLAAEPLLPWQREIPLREAARSVYLTNTLNPTDPLPDWSCYPKGTAMTINNLKMRTTLWGTPDRVTISLMKNNVWDRRINPRGLTAPTLQEIVDGPLAPANKDFVSMGKDSQRPHGLGYLLKDGGMQDPYRSPIEYRFPCQKPVGQIIIGMDDFAGATPPEASQSCANGVVKIEPSKGDAKASLQYVLGMTNDLYAIRGEVNGTIPVGHGYSFSGNEPLEELRPKLTHHLALTQFVKEHGRKILWDHHAFYTSDDPAASYHGAIPGAAAFARVLAKLDPSLGELPMGVFEFNAGRFNYNRGLAHAVELNQVCRFGDRIVPSGATQAFILRNPGTGLLNLNGLNTVPYNGTQYLTPFTSSIISLWNLSSQPFVLKSIDVAEYSATPNLVTLLRITGTKRGGGTVVATYNINHAVLGQLGDFQKLTFDENWSSLEKQTIVASDSNFRFFNGFSMDNIVLEVIPEPSTGMMAVVLACLIAVRRRR